MQVAQTRVQNPMRVKVMGPVYDHLPWTAKLLIEAIKQESQANNRRFTRFAIHDLPKSVNSMYLKNKYTGKKGKSFRLHPAIHEFRLLTIEAMGDERWKWRPVNLMGMIILFENPYWLDGRRRVRQSDLDNRVKVVCDSVEIATEMPDELNWEIHLYKLASKRKRTTVYLFDLGDMVEYYF